METAPSIEPAQIVAGDSAIWSIALSGYPASVGWALSYCLVSHTAQIMIPTTASGDAHLITIAAETTEAWTPGIYAWQSYVTLGEDRHIVGSGMIEIKPNLAAMSTGFDSRSHIKKVLDALEAMLEGRASKDQQSYTIEGLRIDRAPIGDLLRWRDQYRAALENEEQADRIRRGLGHSGRVLVRFR